MLKEFVEYVVKQLVDDKEAVVIRERHDEHKQFYEICVASQDLGKVIGKGGTTIRAVRAIVGIVGAARGVEVIVEVVQ